MTDLLCCDGWWELLSRYLSVCVGFLYTLTCIRPRTMVVVVSKKESLLSFSTSLVDCTVPLKSKLPPLVSCLARRESRLARRETRLARRESRLARRDSRLARTTEAYILEYISSNWLARKRFISRDGFAAMYMYAS